MKTKLILLTAGLCSGIAASAQRFVPAAGINGGGAATMFQNEYYHKHNVNSNIQFTPNAGLQFTMLNPDLSDFYFSIGLQYNTFKQNFDNKGDASAFNYAAYIYTRTSRSTLSYLQMPINVGYQFKWGRVSPFVGIGVAPSFLLDFKQENHSGWHTGAPFYEKIDKSGIFVEDVPGAILGGKTTYNGGSIYKSVNIFAQAKLGVNVEINRHLYFSLDINYSQSLQSVENHNTLKGGYWGFTDFYTSRGAKESELIITSTKRGLLFLEKPNRYNTKLASLGINAGIHIIF